MAGKKLVVLTSLSIFLLPNNSFTRWCALVAAVVFYIICGSFQCCFSLSWFRSKRFLKCFTFLRVWVSVCIVCVPVFVASKTKTTNELPNKNNYDMLGLNNYCWSHLITPHYYADDLTLLVSAYHEFGWLTVRWVGNAKSSYAWKKFP